MKFKRLISIISVVLTFLIIISSVSVAAVTFKSIKKNYNYHYGVDVSTFNEKLDFSKLKSEGVEFMFIRLGYYKSDGGHLDVRFIENIKGCVENGIEFGVYVYSYIYKESDIKDCAAWINTQLENMGNYCKDKNTIQVAYDIEDSTQSSAISNGKISKTNLNKNIKTFCSKIKSYGYIPVVYSFLSYFKSYLDLNGFQNEGIKIWYAQWPNTSSLDTTVKKLMYNNTYADIWQFSDCLTLNGKVFDTNVCYTDFYDYSKEDSKLTAKNLKASYEYTGSAVKPDIKIYSGKTLLKSGKDYKTYYYKNKKLGRATMKIVRFDSSGNYLETKTFRFIIKSPKVSLKAASSDSKVKIKWGNAYGASKYAVYEKSGNTYKKIAATTSTSYTFKSLKQGKKYNYAVRSYSKVLSKGYYSGYSDVSIYTKYKKLVVKKAVSNKVNTATVKWTPKKSKTKGYQIKYAGNKSFSNAKSLTVEGKNIYKAKISNLKSGKKYYFKVRSYNIKSKKKVYSIFSDYVYTIIK